MNYLKQHRLAATIIAIIMGYIIAAVTRGILGHIFALIVWAFAAWSCLGPARSALASRARTWARVGVGAFVLLALYAGSLAVASGLSGSGGSGCTKWLVSTDNSAVVSSSDPTGASCGDDGNLIPPAGFSAPLDYTPGTPAHGAQVCTVPVSSGGAWAVYIGSAGDDGEAQATCDMLTQDASGS